MPKNQPLDVKNIIWGAKRTHYIKFQLKNDISIRYHFLWTNNPSMERKWIIKDHQDNIKETISEDLAKRIIADMCKSQPVEIIGQLDYQTKIYTKRIIKEDGSCEVIDDKILQEKHHKRISKKLWLKSATESGKYFLTRKIGSFTYSIAPTGDTYTLIIKTQNEVLNYEGTYEEVLKIAQEKSSNNKEKTKLYFPLEKRLKKLSKKSSKPKETPCITK